MKQEQIGKFIAKMRKKQNLTQAQLAEKLNVTDRAISKWETGKGMPDSSLMLPLCQILHISVNELLSGEVISQQNYQAKLEENLLETVKQKELADRKLLTLEIIWGTSAVMMYLVLVLLVTYLDLVPWLKLLVIMGATILIFIVSLFLLQIEQVAGFYECRKCHYKYVPSYNQVLWACHIGRTRHMRCPKCKQKSWQKKVIVK